jgi:hypothetical protein
VQFSGMIAKRMCARTPDDVEGAAGLAAGAETGAPKKSPPSMSFEGAGAGWETGVG